MYRLPTGICLTARGVRQQKFKRLISRIMCIALAAVLLTPAEASAHGTTHKEFRGVMPDSYYLSLATCETGLPGTNKPNWKHSTRSYTGGLGIHRGTAARWSGKRDLAKLTPRQQVAIADRIAFKGWTRPDGKHVWRVGPFGWGCLKQSPKLQKMICDSHHPLVSKWKRNCR
jgi:hypothetical protein